MTSRQQRTVFGEVAQSYQRIRPGYPAAVFDDIVSLANLKRHDRVLEVGAGTGKATIEFARRGLHVLAIEPSEKMAELATSAAFSGVRVVVSDFETARIDPTSYRLVAAAQAWHWVDQTTGWRRAADALSDGGWIALLWNTPVDWGGATRAAFAGAYQRWAPELSGRMVAWQAAQDFPDWSRVIEGKGLFGPVTVRHYPWRRSYSVAEYLELLTTQSDHRMLPEERRRGLLEAIAEIIRDRGGTIEVRYVCRLFAAPKR